MSRASPDIERWERDHFKLQVYSYESNAVVKDSQGLLRLPSPTERERLRGFDEGYITQAISPKLQMDEAFDLVGNMVGNSFNVHVIVGLMRSLLCHLGLDADRNWAALAFVPRSLKNLDTAKLVLHFMRQAERGGTDIRLDISVPFRIQAWPRSGVNSSLFNWSVVHSYPWKSHAHITVLELQAVINSVKWRLRRVQGTSTRMLHLMDSQVVCVCGILAKGRTSSFRLRNGLSKLNALLLCSGNILIVGYVDTDSNPSDVLSRWSELRSLQAALSGRLDAEGSHGKCGYATPLPKGSVGAAYFSVGGQNRYPALE